LNRNFKKAVDSLHPKFNELLESNPFRPGSSLPEAGVYLFMEKGRAKYVGRSKNIKRRFQQHRNDGSPPNQAGFATLIAKKELGIETDYRPGPNTHARLQKNRKFMKAFRAAKARIKKMQFRAVAENDATCQALLEVYCAVALNAPYNDFKTH
jgi:hypothetical protein